MYQPPGDPRQPHTSYPQQPWPPNPQWLQPAAMIMQPPIIVQPAPKKSPLPWIILAIVITAILVTCTFCGIVYAIGRSASTSPQTSSLVSQATTDASTPTTAPTQQHFRIGQQVRVNDHWIVTLSSAIKNSGSGFNQPQAGNVYLFVTVTMKNISGQEQHVSSLAQFTLRDTTGQQYTETIDSDAGSTPDGKVAAGSPLKGTIAYETPLSVHTYTFAFEDEVFGPGQAIWDVRI